MLLLPPSSSLRDRNTDHAYNCSRTEPNFRRQNTQDKQMDIAISGHRIGPLVSRGSMRAFWSQDASTRLPIKTKFYGFQDNLQQSMTEVKLLGESMYSSSKREIQSADPTYSREFVQAQLFQQRKVQTSHDCRQVGKLTDMCNRAPPPSREGHAEHVALRKVPDVPDHSAGVRKSNPQEINLNLKNIEKSDLSHLNSQRREKLQVVLSRSASSPDGRLLREHVKLLSFKTREEATRHYRKLLADTDTATKPEVPKVHIVSELERSYTYVPTVREEVIRPQTDVKPGSSKKGWQYTKSKYGLSMQNAISRKVLKKNTLPIPFRKNHNTFLKHYGTPVFDEKTRHYNTPETLVTCTPVSLIN